MRRTRILRVVVYLAAFALFAVAFACGSGDDESDDGGSGIGGDDLDEFLSAIPDEDGLTLSLPESDSTAKAGLGELAVFYDQTVDFTRDVNENVLMFLSWIDEITSYPPTREIENGYEWGPWRASGLSPVDGKFWMTRVEGSTYDYALQWRPKDSDDAWTDIWVGRVVASTDTARRGTGNYSVDFTAAKALDPTTDPEGVVRIVYDTITDGREIAVTYVDFIDESDGMTEPINAEYFYHSHADLTGSFQFEWDLDIHDDEYHGSQYAALEHAWFNTRWQDGGSGRADVVVTGGDLPDIEVFDETIDRLVFAECWGGDFLRDYYRHTVYLENTGAYDVEEQGEESECVFDEEVPSI